MLMAGKKIFLSYSRVDGEIASRLATDLEYAGADVWFDRDDIRLGSVWEKEIENALTACDCLLFLASCSSVASNKAMNEVHFAIEEKKLVLPIKIDDCKIPLGISRLHYIDFSAGYPTGLQALLRELNLQDQSGSAQPPGTGAWGNAARRDTVAAVPEKDRTQQDTDPAITSPEKSPRKGLRVNFTCGVVVAFSLVIVAGSLLLFQENRGEPLADAPGDTAYTGTLDTMTTDATADHTNTAATPPPTASSANALFLMAKEQYDRQQFALAFEGFHGAAKAGQPQAMLFLGNLLLTGRGVPADTTKAIEWYNKAAGAGNADALYALGNAYQKGVGVKTDTQRAAVYYSRAFTAYQKSADAGDSAAMDKVGQLYRQGIGVKTDTVKGKTRQRKASAAGGATRTQ